MCPKQVCEDPQCPFAHTGDELRFTDFYFKTSACMWYAVGKCRNGPGCRFAHGEQELRLIPGAEGQTAQPSGKKGKAEKSDKKVKNANQEKAVVDKPADVQKSEKKAKAERKQKKVEKALDAEASNFKANLDVQSAQVQALHAAARELGAKQLEIQQSLAAGYAQTKNDPMFIQPMQQEPLLSQMPFGWNPMGQSQSPPRPDMPIMDRIDYGGLRELLSTYHTQTIAPMVKAHHQASVHASHQASVPHVSKSKTKFAPGVAHIDPTFQGKQAFFALPGAAVPDIANRSTSREIQELSDHIKSLGEQVQMLQSCISHHHDATKGHVSETTKSGSESWMGHSSSQGSGSSDDISPPGSPLPSVDARHSPQEALHMEASRLSWELQRIALAQGHRNMGIPQ
jgi:hypothetical protein